MVPCSAREEISAVGSSLVDQPGDTFAHQDVENCAHHLNKFHLKISNDNISILNTVYANKLKYLS